MRRQRCCTLGSVPRAARAGLPPEEAGATRCAFSLCVARKRPRRAPGARCSAAQPPSGSRHGKKAVPAMPRRWHASRGAPSPRSRASRATPGASVGVMAPQWGLDVCTAAVSEYRAAQCAHVPSQQLLLTSLTPPESKATNGHSEGSRARRNPRGSASAPGPDLPYIRRAVYTAYICVHRRGVRRTPAFRRCGEKIETTQALFPLV